MSLSPATIMADPVLPVWLLLATVVAALGFAWLSILGSGLERRHCLGIWLLRSGAVLLVAVLLLQPERRVEKKHREKPVLGVVLDTSASMTDQPESLADEPTRAENARAFLTLRPIRNSLEKRYRTLSYTMGAEASPADDLEDADIAFDQPRSHLTRSLNAILPELAGRGAKGLVVLSDGLDQSVEPLAAGARDVPVIAVELEPPVPAAEAEEQELRITDLAYPKRTVVDWRIQVRAVLRRRGAGELSVPVKLHREGHLLQTMPVRFAASQQYQTVTFNIQPPEVGRIMYKLELGELPDGVTSETAAEEFVIEVTDPETRVLYLEGTPQWEFKFLKRALLEDRTISLSAYVRTGGTFVSFSRDGRGTGSEIPTLTAETLADYKALILGDLTADSLDEDAWAAVEDFVDRGGGLLIVGGRRNYGDRGFQQVPAMRKLLPIQPSSSGRMREGRFPVMFSEEGRSHSATKDLADAVSLPPILSVWRPSDPSEFASVLVETGDESPVLAVRRYGQGRVAMLLSNTLWRWRLGTAVTVGDRHVYDAFMARIATWLLPSPEETDAPDTLQLLTRDSEVDVGASVPVGLATGQPADGEGDPSFTCQVRTPDDRTLQVPLSPAQLGADVGLADSVKGYLGHFTPHTEGEYTIEAASADGAGRSTLRLLATRPTRERTGAPVNREFLRRLAEAGNGAFVPRDQWRSALESLDAGGRTVKTVRQTPLWTSPWWLVLLISLFSLEWWWRRRLDLV